MMMLRFAQVPGAKYNPEIPLASSVQTRRKEVIWASLPIDHIRQGITSLHRQQHDPDASLSLEVVTLITILSPELHSN